MCLIGNHTAEQLMLFLAKKIISIYELPKLSRVIHDQKTALEWLVAHSLRVRFNTRYFLDWTGSKL